MAPCADMLARCTGRYEPQPAHRTTLELHVRLFKSYYNLCLVHSSLQGQTPAQAAGLTAHRFTVRELLTYGAT